jgi:hypothetical protein
MEKKMKQPNKPNEPNEPNNPGSKEEVFKKAFEDMCKGLDRFGPKEILNLMVVNSHRDDIVHHLLVQFPTVVALGDFLRTLPVRKVNKRTFKRLQRSGCIV